MEGALELLWVDPKSPPRLRKKREWQALLDGARKQRFASKLPAALPNQTLSPEDRLDVMDVLARSTDSDALAVKAAVIAATRADGRFTPPLLVVAGELRPVFDDLEALKAVTANAIPFTADDAQLEAAVAAALEYINLPDLVPTPTAIEAQARRVREAFARAPRGVAADFLDVQTRTSMLELRRYETHDFDGSPRVRMLLEGADASTQLVVAPIAAVNSLPLAASFRARMVVEVHRFVDEYDPHPFALAVLAVARRIRSLRAEAQASR